MTKRSDLVWGLVIGLVGNLLVSTTFALVEHPEWSPYLNPMYIFSWIAFVVFCSILIFRKDKCEEEKLEKPEIGKKEGKKEPDERSLIAEYEALNDSVNRRSSEMLISDSFLFPISLAVVTFAIIHRKELGTNIFFGVSNAVFLPVLSSVLVFIFYYFWLTTTRINDMCFDRLHEIEKELCIEGHSYIRERIRCKSWWKVRRNMWHIVFWLFIGAFVVTAIWLFREPITL